jgi:aminoglycoside phosphotransferase (APT) family kinase protein
MSEKYSGTRPVTPALSLDTGRLAAWIAENVSGLQGPIEVAQFKGGQSNPTYLLRVGERRCVLRRKPPGTLLASAHAVDREYAVIRALEDTDIPVARAFAFCEDESVAGTAFYLMDYVEGRVFWDPRLPEMVPGERRQIYDEMNRVIAELHGLDPGAVGLDEFGRHGGYVERQVSRWTRQYRAAETETIVAMDQLIEWLPANRPADDETRIVHGDFRIDNLIFDRNAPRIVAVLDWELSTLGHPLADFAYHCMAWRIPPGAFRGLAGTDYAALGIPSEHQYVQDYLRRTGREGFAAREWQYYMAYNLFRLAAILQGVYARALQGNASSANALETGSSARQLAEAAWQQVERLQAS